MGLYNQTEMVQHFAKHVGATTTVEGTTQSSSLSISDDGFGVGSKGKSHEEQEEQTPEVQSKKKGEKKHVSPSSDIVPVVLNVPPLQAVPYVVTRAQKKKATPPSPTESPSKKKTGTRKEPPEAPVSSPSKPGKKCSKRKEKEIDPEETERARAYEASKRRRKLVTSDSEDEEPEDVRIGQLVKGKKTKSKPPGTSPSTGSPLKTVGPTPGGGPEEVTPTTDETNEASKPDSASGSIPETIAEDAVPSISVQNIGVIETPKSQQEDISKKVPSPTASPVATEVPILEVSEQPQEITVEKILDSGGSTLVTETLHPDSSTNCTLILLQTSLISLSQQLRRPPLKRP